MTKNVGFLLKLGLCLCLFLGNCTVLRNQQNEQTIMPLKVAAIFPPGFDPDAVDEILAGGNLVQFNSFYKEPVYSAFGHNQIVAIVQVNAVGDLELLKGRLASAGVQIRMLTDHEK